MMLALRRQAARIPGRAPMLRRLIAISSLLLFEFVQGSRATGAETTVPGDANCDGHVDLSDGIYLLSYLFLGAGPPCPLGDRPELVESVKNLNAQDAQLEGD